MDNLNNNGKNAVKKVRIYQIETESEYAFRGYDFVKEKSCLAPPADIYNVFFDGQLETDNIDDIFYIFNTNHPLDYKGRSLSVSDIIEFYDDTGSNFFYCDYSGYIEIEFEPVKIQYMLITINERDLDNIQLFPTLRETQHIMKNELLEKLGGSFNKYNKGEDYGLNKMSAWSNPKSNWDWKIVRLIGDKNLNIELWRL